MQRANQEEIRRHKTAIGRAEFSRPIRLAIEAGILNHQRSLFDFGCGRGQDISRLQKAGFEANGWDPTYRPATIKKPAEIVNLGYVVNVIESPHERAAVLREAWSLTEQVLLVSARLDIESNKMRGRQFADGCLTSLETFQKFFSQQELRDWVTNLTGSPAIPAAPGVMFVFRDEALRQSYLAARYQRRRVAPRIRKSDRIYNENRETFQPLVDFLSTHGRVPAYYELENTNILERDIGSIRKAYAILRRVMGNQAWDSVREERTDELLLYLALQKLSGRPKFSALPDKLQRDIKEFFSSYKQACELADRLLLRGGDSQIRDTAMRESPVGKLTGNALYVHIDALAEIPAELRIYEGCAHQYIGDIEGANVIKLHRKKPQVSYLVYPSFRKQAHPVIERSLIVRLGYPQIIERDYTNSNNPGILHRKEELLPKNDPDREKFTKLTKQEEKWGLYANPELIGTLEGWNTLLTAKGLIHRGHQLRSRK